MSNGGNGFVISHSKYVAGWLDLSIHDFLAHLPWNAKTMAFALVTSLDSDLAPKRLLERSPELQPLARSAKAIGDGFLVPSSLLLNLEKPIFHGFDEVFFFPGDQVTPKPKTWLVGPRRIDQAKIDQLGDWMLMNGCSLALGDGDGLNFIMKAQGLVKYLLAHSLTQPAPTNEG